MLQSDCNWEQVYLVSSFPTQQIDSVFQLFRDLNSPIQEDSGVPTYSQEVEEIPKPEVFVGYPKWMPTRRSRTTDKWTHVSLLILLSFP